MEQNKDGWRKGQVGGGEPERKQGREPRGIWRKVVPGQGKTLAHLENGQEPMWLK